MKDFLMYPLVDFLYISLLFYRTKEKGLGRLSMSTTYAAPEM